MRACYAHAKDDPNPPRARRPPRATQGARGPRRPVPDGLPARGAARARRAALVGRMARAGAETEAHQAAAHVVGGHHSGHAGQDLIVVDASAVVALLVWPASVPRLAERLHDERSVHVPAVLDLEVTQTIRRLCALREIPEKQGRLAVEDLEALAARRYPHAPLLPRIWQLRANLSAYDAAYVALAESLDARLLTRDRRLAKTRGHRARIDLV